MILLNEYGQDSYDVMDNLLKRGITFLKGGRTTSNVEMFL